MFIEGILQQDKWVSKEDGKTYTKVQIIGRNINIIEKDKTNQANDENLTNSNQARNLAQNPNHKTQDMEVVKI